MGKRLISDNVIVAFEAFHSMSNGPNRFALKIDLRKAFDRTEWNFLEYVMVAMHFPMSLVTLIILVFRCSLFVLINGSPSDSFSLSHAICQ